MLDSSGKYSTNLIFIPVGFLPGCGKLKLGSEINVENLWFEIRDSGIRCTFAVSLCSIFKMQMMGSKDNSLVRFTKLHSKYTQREIPMQTRCTHSCLNYFIILKATQSFRFDNKMQI